MHQDGQLHVRYTSRSGTVCSSSAPSPSFANLADQGVDGEAPQASQASDSGSDARDAGHG